MHSSLLHALIEERHIKKKTENTLRENNHVLAASVISSGVTWLLLLKNVKPAGILEILCILCVKGNLNFI